MRNRLLIIGVLVLSVASVAFGTDYAIVVNPANPLRALSLVELGKIFKAKTTIWPDGIAIRNVLPTNPRRRSPTNARAICCSTRRGPPAGPRGFAVAFRIYRQAKRPTS